MLELPKKTRIRVLVADDTRIHTELLSGTLRCDPTLDVKPWSGDTNQLLVQSAAGDFDVLLVSSQLEEQPRRGLELLRAVRSSQPNLRAVVLLGSSGEEMILESFRSGARGVFSKQESIETLAKCIRCVHQGQIWASSRDMALALSALASSPQVRAVDSGGLDLLSKRELEVVRCLSEGLTNREIAERLGLSQHTVKNYLFKVFDKLGVSSRVELLFMTLSQDSNSRAMVRHLLNDTASTLLKDGAGLSECKKAAEEGASLAPLALAQLYASGKGDLRNLVNSYMWYLIALDQTTDAMKQLSRTMTPAQIMEAEQQAAMWHARTAKMSAEVNRFDSDSLPPSSACAD